jgi:hypothetical protein
MHGPAITSTMASIFNDTNNDFHRSFSSSNIPDLTLRNFQTPQTSTDTKDLPRSASYTGLPVLESQSYTSTNGSFGTTPENKAIVISEDIVKHGRSRSGEVKTTPQEEDPLKSERLGRRKSLVARPKSWLQRTRSSPDRKIPPVPTVVPILPPPVDLNIPKKTKKLSGSFASFARNTWISASRSPSPSSRTSKNDDSSLNEDDSTAASSVSSSSP